MSQVTLHFPNQVYSTTGDLRGCTLLSKCANPGCSEQFRFLHQGKLFVIIPTPAVWASVDDSFSFLFERFWLCDSCSTKMTLVWGGTKVKIVPLPEKPLNQERPLNKEVSDSAEIRPADHRRRHAARAGVQSG